MGNHMKNLLFSLTLFSAFAYAAGPAPTPPPKAPYATSLAVTQGTSTHSLSVPNASCTHYIDSTDTAGLRRIFLAQPTGNQGNYKGCAANGSYLTISQANGPPYIQWIFPSPPPVCPPQPAPLTQHNACVLPQVGPGWDQTATFSAAVPQVPPNGCWVQNAWTPATAPAGACTTPPPVCPPKPDPVSQLLECPFGTHGNGWTQTHDWIAHVPQTPPDQCWDATAWTPATPPSTVCVPNTSGGAVETTFDSFYPAGFALLTDVTSNWSYQRPAKPAKATSLSTPGYTDTVHGTKVWRITDLTADCTPNSDHCRHEYAKRNPFNVDNTRYFATDGQGYWWLFDASTFRPLHKMTGFAGDTEPFWTDDPHVIWRTDREGGMKWYAYNTESDTTSVLFDLTGKLPASVSSGVRTWFKGEGRPSNDGRYWGLLVTAGSGNSPTPVGAIMYDRTANAVIGAVPFTTMPDHTMTSSLGNYYLISYYNSTGVRACAKNYSGPITGCTILTGGNVEHGDVGLDVNSQEVYVQNDYGSSDTAGYIRVSHMDGTHFAIAAAHLYPVGGASVGTHISGIVSQKHPGWFLVDFEGSCANYNGTCPDPTQRYMYDRVGFMELKANGRFLWVSEHTSSGASYFNEPQATSNRDGTRVVWASAWNFRDGAASSAAESYMVGLPSTAIPN